METIYYGEQRCSKEPCRNKAYYICNGNYLCGVHSKNKTRVELPHRDKNEALQLKMQRIKDEKLLIENERQQNVLHGRSGNVILSKMYMMKDPEYVKGFLKVFPNYKHQNRIDGYGCMRLSPMYLGPIKHGQPGLPDALNLENFHQANKVFPWEVDENGNPSPIYYENKHKMYLDPKPHRHKFMGKNKNSPVYSIWVDKSGQEHRLNYIESRQFYCNFYERLASAQEDYQRLYQMIREGYNLQICGYDAYPVDPTPKAIEKAYLDPSKPFGHELVLYTMLILPIETYPWRKYKTFDF